MQISSDLESCKHRSISVIRPIILITIIFIDSAKFPLSIIGKALQVFNGGWIMGYDIGAHSAKQSNTAVLLANSKLRTVVAV